MTDDTDRCDVEGCDDPAIVQLLYSDEVRCRDCVEWDLQRVQFR